MVVRFVVTCRLMGGIGLMSLMVRGGSVSVTVVVISDFVVVLSGSDSNYCGESE